jgi:hypothetical protein
MTMARYKLGDKPSDCATILPGVVTSTRYYPLFLTCHLANGLGILFVHILT